jgi:UDP-glucose 4-epimerase
MSPVRESQGGRGGPSASSCGGAGFIGSHVADALIAQGSRRRRHRRSVHGQRGLRPPAGDVPPRRHRFSASGPFIADWRPDAVAHLAAQVSVRDSVADPVQDAAYERARQHRAFEACRKAGTSRIVFASTGGAMYGLATRLPTPETEAPTPLSPYGCAKLAVEGYLGYFARVHRMKACALRFANVYGPRQSPHGEAGVVAIFAARLRKEAPTIYGDGSQTRLST